MKSRISIAVLFLLAAFASSPPKTQAVWWVDELGDCTDNYVQDAHDINDLYDTYQITEEDWRYLHDVIWHTYTGCLSPIHPPQQQPDFCDDARIAQANCDAQFADLGLEASASRMECRAKSGIDYCQ